MKGTGESNLRVAVAGAGAFGRNHLRVYRELETHGAGVALVAAVEPDADRAAAAADKYAIPVFSTVDELLGGRLESSTRPRSPFLPFIIMRWLPRCWMRASTCWWKSRWRQPCRSRRSDCAAPRRAKRILQPGHLERFNPAVLAVQPQLRTAHVL